MVFSSQEHEVIRLFIYLSVFVGDVDRFPLAKKNSGKCGWDVNGHDFLVRSNGHFPE